MASPSTIKTVLVFAVLWVVLMSIQPARVIVLRQFDVLGAAVRRELWIGLVSGAVLIGVDVALRLAARDIRFRGVDVASPLSTAATAVLIAFLVASEEIVFRGVLLTRLSALVRPAGAVVVTAVLFAAFHFADRPLNGPQAVEFLLDGLFLGALTVATGSIWGAVGWHFAKNLGVAETFGASARVTEPWFRLVPASPRLGVASSAALDVLVFALSVSVATALLAVTHGSETH